MRGFPKSSPFILVLGIAAGLASGTGGALASSTSGCLDVSGRWPFGAVEAVSTLGHYGLIGSGTALVVADLSNPLAPATLGSIALPDQPQAICAVGTTAYVADRLGGLLAVDVSDPRAPAIVGALDTQDYPSCVRASGGYLYVGGWIGLHVIDIGTPGLLRQVGFMPEASIADLAISGTMAYAASGNYVLAIDLTFPSHPIQCGYMYWGSSYGFNGIAVSGALVCLATREGLLTVDISTPCKPVEAGYFSVTQGAGRRVVFTGNRALLAAGAGGLCEFDVSAPSAPVLLGTLPTQSQTQDVALSGGVALVADWVGLRMADVSSPGTPVALGYLGGPGAVAGIALDGTTACAGMYHNQWPWDLDSYLQILDLSDVSHLAARGTFDRPQGLGRCVVAGNDLYVSEPAGGIKVLDISDRDHPIVAGSLSVGVCTNEMVVQGGYAYLGDGLSFYVVDVHNPGAPALAATVSLNEPTYAMALDGNRAYLLTLSGLRVFDVSDPLHPAQVGQVVPNVNLPGRLAAGGGMLYVIDTDAGFVIYDAHDPANMQRVGETYLDRAEDIALHGSTVFVTRRGEGLVAVDVSQPASPQVLGTLSTGGDSYGLAVSGSLVAWADGLLGFSIIDVSSCADTCNLSCSPQCFPQGGGLAPLTVQFRAMVQAECGDQPSLLWDFGDGTTSSEENPSHVYPNVGYYYWSQSASLHGRTCGGSGVLQAMPAPPVITRVKDLLGPFRLKVTGSNFQRGLRMLINGEEWPGVQWKNAKSALLKGGTALESLFPDAVPVSIDIVNPDGGMAETTYTKP